MQIQIVESMEIRNGYSGGLEPRKISGIVFCKNCGRQYFENEIKNSICSVCNNTEFLSGEIAEVLAGYLKLDNEGNLKKYYKEKYGKNSVIKMNSKRIIIWMLIKQNYMISNDKEIEDIVSRIMWKKF